MATWELIYLKTIGPIGMYGRTSTPSLGFLITIPSQDSNQRWKQLRKPEIFFAEHLVMKKGNATSLPQDIMQEWHRAVYWNQWLTCIGILAIKNTWSFANILFAHTNTQ